MHFYEDIEKTSENRMPTRSYYVPEGVSRKIDLNGVWDFFYFENGNTAGDEDAPLPRIGRIPVPSCWQLQGYGSPNYTNANFPFTVDPPYVPNVNPMGRYERDFELAEAPAEEGMRLYLRLEGAATLTVYGGPIEGDYTFATGTSFVSVGGALTLDGTSVLSLTSDALTGGSVKIDAQTVSVGASAKIDARGKGYAWLDSNTPPDAPGLGYSYSIGGSHGGKGGSNTGDSVYDSRLAPVMPGSPNGSYSNGQKPGGGVIRIHARAISIDGTLDADAVSPNTFGGSAGGSIWLTADTFAFGPQANCA